MSPLLERAAALREHSARHDLSQDKRLAGCRADLTLTEVGLVEARAARFWLAVKATEQSLTEMRPRIASADMEGRPHSDAA